MRKANQKKVKLGDLVAALFDETRKVTANRVEQNLLVYVALKDLLRRRSPRLIPIALKA